MYILLCFLVLEEMSLAGWCNFKSSFVFLLCVSFIVSYIFQNFENFLLLCGTLFTFFNRNVVRKLNPLLPICDFMPHCTELTDNVLCHPAMGVKLDISAEMKDKASGGRVGYGSSFSSIHQRPLTRPFVSERCSLKNARRCYPPWVCSWLCLWRLSSHPTHRSGLSWLILILNHNAFLILILFFFVLFFYFIWVSHFS